MSSCIASFPDDQSLAIEIAALVGFPYKKLTIGNFSDSELYVPLLAQPLPSSLWLVATLWPNFESRLVRLLMALSRYRQQGVRWMGVVAPYIPYGRQGQKHGHRGDLLWGRLLRQAGAAHLVTLDTHRGPSAPWFCEIPGAEWLVPAIVGDWAASLDQVIVVAPDKGSERRAVAVASQLNIPFITLNKIRKGSKITIKTPEISLVGKTCILVDDIISTGATLKAATEALCQAGAASVGAYISHFVMAAGYLAKLQDFPLKFLVITDTIQPTIQRVGSSCIRVHTIAPVIAQRVLQVLEGNNGRTASCFRSKNS